MCLEIAKRQVETGRDVVILLDSITRLARAYNLALPASGKTLSGGVDPVALYPPKRFFGAARNIENGGIADDHRHLPGRHRLAAWTTSSTRSSRAPATWSWSSTASSARSGSSRPSTSSAPGTRREELLLDENELQMVWTMRRMLSAVGPNEGIELLMQRLGKTKNNAEFLVSLSKSVEASERP